MHIGERKIEKEFDIIRILKSLRKNEINNNVVFSKQQNKIVDHIPHLLKKPRYYFGKEVDANDNR